MFQWLDLEDCHPVWLDDAEKQGAGLQRGQLSLLPDKVKDRNEIETEMVRKSLGGLGDRTETNKTGGKVMPEEEAEKVLVLGTKK